MKWIRRQNQPSFVWSTCTPMLSDFAGVVRSVGRKSLKTSFPWGSRVNKSRRRILWLTPYLEKILFASLTLMNRFPVFVKQFNGNQTWIHIRWVCLRIFDITHKIQICSSSYQFPVSHVLGHIRKPYIQIFHKQIDPIYLRFLQVYLLRRLDVIHRVAATWHRFHAQPLIIWNAIQRLFAR